MKIELHKVHLSKKNEVSFEYKETDKESSAPVAKGPFTVAVHEDLILAMSKLDIHLALMTGQFSFKGKIENVAPDLYENFHAKSYSFTGDKTKGIIISGNRVLDDGKIFNFNTPNYLLEQSEETGYKHMEDLLKWVEKINTEGIAFLDGSKRGNDPQGKIPFEDAKGKGAKTVISIDKPRDEWTPEDYKAEMKLNQKNGIEDAEVVSETKNDPLEGKVTGKGQIDGKKIKELPGGKKGKRKVAQSAAAPSGEIDHPEDES